MITYIDHHPNDWIPKTVTDWKTSSTFQEFLRGDFDPENQDPPRDWEFEEYSVNTVMFANVFEKFTDTDIETWKISESFYMKQIEVMYASLPFISNQIIGT